jgi:hypothetical protein
MASNARLISFAVFGIGFASIGASTPPGAAPSVVQRGPQRPNVPQLAPKTVSISGVSVGPTGLVFEISNATSSTATLNLIHAQQSVTVHPVANGKTNVTFAAVPLDNACELTTLTFRLAGPEADTRERTVAIGGQETLTFTTHVGVNPGPAPAQGAPDPALNKVSIVSGTIDGPYQCGKKLGVHVTVKNDTDVNPTRLTLSLTDLNHVNVGGTSIKAGAKSQGVFAVETKANVSGRAVPFGTVGDITFTLSDDSNGGSELGPKVLATRTFWVQPTRTGGALTAKLAN